jgi:hypothetical protein
LALALSIAGAGASRSSAEFQQRETPRDLSRESEIMAAAWEEDDALAAELEQEPAEVLEESVPQEETGRSVVTKRKAANPLNTVDPFEADDRYAQLPNDPFEEPTDDKIPDVNQNLEEVEDALDREIESREAEDEEPADDAAESEPADSIEEFSEENNAAEREEIEQGQLGTESPTNDFDFQLQTPPKPQSEVVRPYQQEQDARLADEIVESQKSCEEEIAALRADRINSVDLNIRVDGEPGEDFPYECTLGAGQVEPRVWPEITYTWKASALCHKPLYFEDVQLERYGHSWLPDVQPFVSGAHFFGTVAILPYKMGLETPNECIYALGHYRPGSCAPYYIEALPFNWRAAAFQAGVITGIHFALP